MLDGAGERAVNQGVVPDAEVEEAGTLKGTALMFLAPRRYPGAKVVTTLRKAFGVGSPVLGVNPWDHQVVSLALSGVSLGGVPAIGGAAATKANDMQAAKIQPRRSGA